VFIKHVLILNIVTSTRDSNPRLLTVRESAKSSNSRVNTRTRESGKPATCCKGTGFPRGGCGFPFLTHGLPVINPKSHYLQIRIRVEHTMGMLKGTFQSLKEIRIQLINTKCHMVIIMWARVCIILHNLIIRIEGDNFDEIWREGLVRWGLDEHGGDGNIDEEDALGDALELARRRVEMPGQHFRLKVMDALFDSPSHNVERRP
jgi:hypothetical protein